MDQWERDVVSDLDHDDDRWVWTDTPTSVRVVATVGPRCVRSMTWSEFMNEDVDT